MRKFSAQQESLFNFLEDKKFSPANNFQYSTTIHSLIEKKFNQKYVEYKKITDITRYEQPNKYIVHDTDYNNSYKIPVLTAGQTFLLGYTNEKDNIYLASENDPVIIFDDFTGAYKWVDFNFKIKSSAIKIIKAKNEFALLRYIYHLMGVINYKSDEHKRIWIGKYSEFKIPVPPLPVQEEIVRILDKFTKLTNELTNELTKRKQQYQHYRDKLLTFSETSIYKQLQDVCKLQNGFAFKSNLFREQGKPIIRITNIYCDRIISDNIVFFDDNDYKEDLSQFILDPGDFVVAMSGATTGKIGINNTNKTFYINQRVGKFIPNEKYINKRFLYHYLLSKTSLLYQLAGGGAQPNLSTDSIKKMQIPVPSLHEQERIVSILDRFDAICNDLTSGLPAEIEARKKQYEYYRDKLLTFKELPS